MGFDETARKAGIDLREATHGDVEAALAELQRAVPGRRRARISVVTFAVAAALVVAVAASRSLLPEQSRNLEPAPPPQEVTLPTSSPGHGCEHPLITCYGGRRSSVAMTVPMRWKIPDDFNMPYSGDPPTTGLVETYTRRGVPGGVTVLEGISAAETLHEYVPVPEVRTAESFANWLVQRPFLSSSPVRTGSVAGQRAWIVDAVVKPGRPAGPATCNAAIDCYPIILVEDSMVGTWQGLANRYTVLDLPGAGVTVVWSWGLEGEIPPAADDVIASLRFD
jgi:hypothetical protein